MDSIVFYVRRAKRKRVLGGQTERGRRKENYDYYIPTHYYKEKPMYNNYIAMT